MAISCPVCDATIDVDEDELDEGDSLACDECGADLRVASLDPLELESLDDEEDEEDALDLDDDEEDDEEEEEDETWK
jgi:lysine biosynthesis protein LysW